ncbi:hypothetical protein FHS79_000968 [Polymorphobacter multimanifer]|uniref:Uncharacterized protein n=1 Tax=Polymorphobacter multimanifer TaxID=1070431 RepID=A0A841L3E7_9SPHN|nr:hypothetical protein [Polymorphobacter multimanifer]MBB6226806.1 hypothetical protein [Polymorphobacter multimanifer]
MMAAASFHAAFVSDCVAAFDRGAVLSELIGSWWRGAEWQLSGE